ncbi:MAG: helix-turn-helix transcriptional regulator [Actinomycetota bacterium]|nr:helix-turn-helix transcriptional regulator [Actinomycetota bacterium]
MSSAASYVNQARRAAGLSQRQLADRTGIPQSAIARIERGHQDPRVETLERLLRACDFELRLGPKRGGGVDRSLIRSMLQLSPGERLQASTAYGRFMERARRAKRIDRPA